MSLPELNHRILVAAKRNGWVTDEEFNRTRPVLNRKQHSRTLGLTRAGL